MKQRTIGANGPRVGAIGFGAMSIVGAYGPTDEATSFRALERAVALGVTHIDTARVYGLGRSEELIARFMKANPGHGFVLATKGGMYTSPDGVRHFDNSKVVLREHLEGSLARLGIDSVPLYYIHRREQRIEIEAVMETLLTFKEEGKIGGIGFSEISPASLRRAAKVGPVDAVQSEYSLWTRQPEMGMLQACKEVGATFVAFSPMGRGMLGSKPIDVENTNDLGMIRTGNPRFTEPNYSANVAWIDRFRTVAAEAGAKPASLAMAWVLDQGEHVIPIPGTRTAEHLEELVAGDAIEMTDDLRAAIDEALPIGFAHGDRYTDKQLVGIERYC